MHVVVFQHNGNRHGGRIVRREPNKDGVHVGTGFCGAGLAGNLDACDRRGAARALLNNVEHGFLYLLGGAGAYGLAKGARLRALNDRALGREGLRDHVGVHGDAAVGDGCRHDRVLHGRGLRAGGVPLAHGLAGARPCQLPLGHQRGVGHDGGRGREVQAKGLPVAKGVGVLHQGGGAYLVGNLAKDYVGRDREGAAQRNGAKVGVLIVGDVGVADLHAGGGAVGLLQAGCAGVERGGERDHLEGGARRIERLGGAVVHGDAGFLGRADRGIDVVVVVAGRGGRSQHGAGARVEDHDGSAHAGERLLGGRLNARVDGEHDGIARLRDACERVHSIHPAGEKLLGHKNLATTQIYGEVMGSTIIRDLKKCQKR